MGDLFRYWHDYLSWFIPNMFGIAQPHLHFYAMSFVIIVSAIGVVVARNLVHAAMLLALCFIAIAGIFVLLGAEFLAAVQVLVYAGGVVTLIIFAIMLSESITGRRTVTHNRQSITAFVVAVVMAIVMVAILLYDENGYFVGPSRWALTPQRNDFPTEPNVQLIGKSLMSTYTLAFWVASVVLTVAMIGGLILARSEKDSADGEVPAEGVEEKKSVSPEKTE